MQAIEKFLNLQHAMLKTSALTPVERIQHIITCEKEMMKLQRAIWRANHKAEQINGYLTDVGEQSAI